VHTRDPRSGKRNIGMYRMQVYDGQTTGMHWQRQKNAAEHLRDRLRAAMAHEAGALFHTDAVQAAGKLAIDLKNTQIDMLSLSAHKFHGPKGAGLLFIKSPLHPHPLVFGGAHENERRAGTENLPAIAGFVSALEKFTLVPVFDKVHLKSLINKLLTTIKTIPACHIVSPSKGVLDNTVAFTVNGSDGITLLANLDLEGVCASSGSACTAGSIKPSHVVTAIGRPSEAHSLIRFSLGRDTTTQEVDFVCSILPEIITRSQRG